MNPIYIVMEIRTVEHEGGYAVVTSNTQHEPTPEGDGAESEGA